MATWLAQTGQALKEKGLRYWLIACGVVILGLLAGHRLNESDLWLKQRRAAYRAVHTFVPRESKPKWVTLILIEDDEYWLGDLAGRRPTDRNYLARLTSAAAMANPRLVALDFSFRSPSPEGNPVIHPAYSKETDKLLATIRDVGAQCPVIIAKTLGLQEEGRYLTESDIYDRFDFGGARVLKGYIALPRDERRVPAAPMPLKEGGSLDSFSGAIVRAVHPELLRARKGGDTTLPFGDFMNLEAFTRVSARDVLRGDPSTLAALAHRLVIIGAHWHDTAVHRWDVVDLHGSPNGDMPGVVLHANYVEAILDARVHWGWPPLVLHVIEFFGAALVAIIFALKMGPLVKALALMGMVCMLIVFSFFSLLVLGLVFDFFVPVVSVIGHGIVERVLEWRKAALSQSDKSPESKV